MDNLGEALEVQLGQWPPGKPFGTHPSIKNSLPRVLDILARNDVKATYFIESWSLAIYPEVATDLQRRGHEIGWHAYQHEMWDKLTPEQEEQNLEKSLKTASEAGVTYAGFRPPSGKPNDTTIQLLKRHGFRYISPVGEALGLKEGLVELPFQWKEVDALYYVPELCALRQSIFGEEKTLEPNALRSHLLSQIQKTVEEGGYLVILFHPAQQNSEDRFRLLEDVVERISQDTDIWCAPCDKVADWIMEHQLYTNAASVVQ